MGSLGHRPIRLLGIAALVAAVAVVPARAAGASQPSAGGDPYSPQYGHPYRHGAVPKRLQARMMAAYEATHPAATTATVATTNANTLTYGGSNAGIGVTSGTPRVYLVFWGSQWGIQGTDPGGDLTFSSDLEGGAPDLQRLFRGLGTGGELWSATMTQYCDGQYVAKGATSCPAWAAHVGYPTGGALAGAWYDGGNLEPLVASGNQIGQVAVAAAAHFGNMTAASNRYAQYIILSAPGTDPDGYQDPANGFCGYHDFSSDPTLTGGPIASPYGVVAFTNLPYLLDPIDAVACGQGFVNSPGLLDGYSIIAGHEYAETLTDQAPFGGWSNPATGAESADECDWIKPGLLGGAENLTLSTGFFAMQSVWSNDVSACVMAHPIVQNVPPGGYWTVAADGGVFSFGGSAFYGSMGGKALSKPIVGMAVAPGGGGYYLVASDGGVFSFGPAAAFYGSMGGKWLSKPIVGMAVAPGGGYYLVASDGGVFAFGAAPFLGSEGGKALNAPIVAMATVPGGYYLVASDGGVFTFGSAPFYGSEGGKALNAPIVGMAAAPGGGYYLVASDGGIFTFGPGSMFQGSMGGKPLNKPIVGMSVDPGTGGYWMDASDGGVFAFHAPFDGSMGGTRLVQPMVGMSTPITH